MIVGGRKVWIEGFHKMREIPGFPDYYADRNGRIYSNKGRRLVELTPAVYDGYDKYRLWVDGRQVNAFRHLLVARTFLPPRPSKNHLVLHGDGCRANCSVNNLSWGLHLQNAKDRDVHGRTVRGEKHHLAKLTLRDVDYVRMLGRSGLKAKEIALRLEGKTSLRNVQKILAGTAWCEQENQEASVDIGPS